MKKLHTYVAEILVLAMAFQGIAKGSEGADQTGAPVSGEVPTQAIQQSPNEHTVDAESIAQVMAAMSHQTPLQKIGDFTMGNFGFMVGAAAQSLLSSTITGDPAIRWGVWDALTSVDGLVNLAAFSMGSEMTTTALMSMERYKTRGPQFVSTYGMVVGGMTSQVVGKIGATVDFKEFSLNFKEWGRLAEQRVSVQGRISRLKFLRSLFMPDADNAKKMSVEITELEKQLANLNRQSEPYRQGFWQTWDVLKTKGIIFNEEEAIDLGLSTVRMVIASKILHQGTKIWYAAKGRAMNSLEKKIAQDKVAEDLEGLGVNKSFAAKLRVRIKNLIGRPEVDLFAEKTAPGPRGILPKSLIPFTVNFGMIAWQAVKFLSVDQWLESRRVEMWDPLRLNSRLNEKLQEISTAGMKYVNARGDMNVYFNDMVKSFDDYEKVMDTYRSRVVMKDLNHHHASWQAFMTKLEVEYYKKSQYLKWMARGAKLDDPDFVNNGKDMLPWHIEAKFPNELENEKKEVAKGLALALGEPKLEIAQITPALVVKYLTEEKQGLDDHLLTQTYLRQKTLFPYVNESFFTATAPLTIRFLPQSKGLPFNLVDSLIFEARRLKGACGATLRGMPLTRISMRVLAICDETQNEKEKYFMSTLNTYQEFAKESATPSDATALGGSRHVDNREYRASVFAWYILKAFKHSADYLQQIPQRAQAILAPGSSMPQSNTTEDQSLNSDTIKAASDAAEGMIDDDTKKK